ncbi:MAG: HAD family hydrolase [Anaerolineae bacterium]|nr:HAD family hydrolase [Anaerolineae bacterium]
MIPQTQPIRDSKAIFLDLGNTLRVLVKDQAHMAQARCKIVELLGSDQDPTAFCQELDARYKIYRKWAFENLTEASEAELWTRWLAPEFPAEQVAPLGAELTFQFRQSMGRRRVVEGGREVVDELYRRGYVLGIISNLIGTREIPEWLQADGFAPYFKAVALSSILGRRKPDPAIYLEAARLAGVEPARCIYVGDNPKRDVVGARQAGFGMVVLIMTHQELAQDPIALEHRPDLIIHEFCELLDVFPGVADA